MLSGCGFYLRGTEVVPTLSHTSTVQIVSSYPELNFIFAEEFRNQGFIIGDSDVDFAVHISDESHDGKEVGFDTELVAEFKRINYRLVYEVVDQQGQVVIAQKSFARQSGYFNPEGTFLQQQAAKESALKQLRGQAAATIAMELIFQSEDFSQ